MKAHIGLSLFLLVPGAFLLPGAAHLPGALDLHGAAAASSDQAQPGSVEHARAQFEAGRYGEGAIALESVVAAAPADASAYYWLGRLRLELHEYARAVDAFKHASDLRPQDSEDHRWLGRAYGEQADNDHSFSLARRSRQQFEEAVRLAPSNIAARRDLLQFYLEAPWILGGGEDKAQHQAEEISALDSTAGHLAWAVCWAHRNDADGVARAKARAEYQAVLQAKPNEVGPYFEAAEFYEKQRDAAGLRSALESASRVDPRAPSLRYFRGVLEVMAGVEPADAEASLKAYLTAVPPRSDRPPPAAAHEWLGRLYESLSRPALAASEYQEALRLDPHRKSAREGLQRVMTRANDE